MKRPRDTEEGPDTDGLTLLHRSRLVPWSIAAVTCIAACPDGSVFAAGYDDGKVEVFDATIFNCLAVSTYLQASGLTLLLTGNAAATDTQCQLLCLITCVAWYHSHKQAS